MNPPPAVSPAAKPGSPTPFDPQARDFDRRVILTEADGRAIAAAVIELAGLRPGERLLEIGAGTGTIGRWFLERPLRPVHYVGLDLSRGMLEVFRQRQGTARGLVQADGAAPWPLPVGAARAVFSSRAIHLLPQEHVVGELLRVTAPEGGACVLGWVERPPESVKGRMSRRMRELLRERGFSPRSAGGRRLLEALRQRGAEELPRTVVVRWPIRHSPRESLANWRGKVGLGGIVLPPGVQEEILARLETWAGETWGDLEAAPASEESYVLEGARLPATGKE
ncbi:MAG TPA: class I SAM-dependent methyltransferase [Thermoanaerobaculia bacterium]|nr:class I SAM-dependent methyltransferase [Thermoanaerobaculia bacterium]